MSTNYWQKLLLQIKINVCLFFHCVIGNSSDFLNLFLEWQEWCLYDLGECKWVAIKLYVKSHWHEPQINIPIPRGYKHCKTRMQILLWRKKIKSERPNSRKLDSWPKILTPLLFKRCWTDLNVFTPNILRSVSIFWTREGRVNFGHESSFRIWPFNLVFSSRLIICILEEIFTMFVTSGDRCLSVVHVSVFTYNFIAAHLLTGHIKYILGKLRNYKIRSLRSFNDEWKRPLFLFAKIQFLIVGLKLFGKLSMRQGRVNKKITRKVLHYLSKMFGIKIPAYCNIANIYTV